MPPKETKLNEAENLKRASRIFKNIDFNLLSKSVIGLYSSSSQQHGVDCLSLSSVVIEFLKIKGIKAKIVIGECAWRVDGKSDGGVISHIANGGTTTVISQGGEAIPFHAWIQLNDYWFLDLTTYQFQIKMNQLNQDGQNVPVSWNPNFILFSLSDLNSFKTVQESYSSGVIFYKPDKILHEKIIAKTNGLVVDDEDVNSLELIYKKLKSNELDIIFGPNSNVFYS